MGCKVSGLSNKFQTVTDSRPKCLKTILFSVNHDGILLMETKAKNIVQLKDVKKNVLVHKVYGLGCNSFVEDIILLSEPSSHSELAEAKYKKFDMSQEKEWVKTFRTNGCYNDNISLCDMGIIPNDYNSHKTFLTVEDARIYLQECIDGHHPSPISHGRVGIDRGPSVLRIVKGR